MKRKRKIIGFGICIGIMLAIAKNAVGLENALFWRYYGIFAAIILVGSVGINIAYNRSYQRKMQRILSLLEERPREYIAQLEGMLEKAKGENLRNVLRLNLAAGYMEAGERPRAIAILEELSGQRLPGAAAKVAHTINLCECYFYTNQSEKAMQLYRENTALFTRFREDAQYGGNIAALDILAAYCEGELARAAELLEAAQRKWDKPRFQRDFQEIAAHMDGRERETKEKQEQG